jgi:hypothetical protein
VQRCVEAQSATVRCCQFPSSLVLLQRSDLYGHSSSTYSHPSLGMYFALSFNTIVTGVVHTTHSYWTWSQVRRLDLRVLIRHVARFEQRTCSSFDLHGTLETWTFRLPTFSTLLKQRRLENGHYNTRSHALEVDSTHAGQDRHSTKPTWINGVLRTRPPETHGNGEYTHTQGSTAWELKDAWVAQSNIMARSIK